MFKVDGDIGEPPKLPDSLDKPKPNRFARGYLGVKNGDKSAWPNAIQRARLESGGSEAARSVALSDET